MGNTVKHYIPYPEPADAPNIPGDLRGLAEKVDSSLFSTQILQCTSSTRPTGGDLYPGRFIFETDTKAYGIWDGTVWRMWDTNEQTYTTSWQANGTAVGLSLGTGGFIRSKYYRRGSRCRIDLHLNVGNPGFGGGVGNWTFTVPFMPTVRGHFSVKCWAPNAGGNFAGYAYVEGSTTLTSFVPASNSNTTLLQPRNCDLSANLGSGYPYPPGNFTWTTVGDFSIFGEYSI